MRAKKILLLGGSAQQIVAIQTAKQLDYYTVLCDYLPDNPGQHFADKFYLVSTTDKDAVLQVARDEAVDGVLAYSSDPAAPTAAYVSEKLGLPGIPYSIAKCFCEKNLFRAFLHENGFHVPGYAELHDNSDLSEVQGLHFPLIIKPGDSSGSKGVTVVHSFDEVKPARKTARQYSRNGIVIVEEFIERDHPDVIEAEIIVVDGKVAVWGLMSTIRDDTTNPLVPAAYSYPIGISPERVELVKREITALMQCSQIRYGAFNIEAVIDNKNRLFFLDVGPRNGGNELPEFIGYIMNDNLVQAILRIAIGDYEPIKTLSLDGSEGGFWGMAVLHSTVDGIFKGTDYSELARKCLIREDFFLKPGTAVSRFAKSKDAIGLAFFHFQAADMRDQVLNDFIGEHIKVLVETNQRL